MAGCTQQTTKITTYNADITITIRYSITGLSKAFNEINRQYYEINPDITIDSNYASPETLEKMLSEGTGVDIYVSATPRQMDNLQESGLIIADSRRNFLSNSMVLIVPSESVLEIDDFTDLTGQNVEKIVIGDPGYVTAGAYAQQILDEFGIAEEVGSKLIYGSEGYSVLSYVESGYADAGIVYLSDATISTKVKIVATAPADINSLITCPLALITGTENYEAVASFVDFLYSDQVKAIFEEYGFGTLY